MGPICALGTDAGRRRSHHATHISRIHMAMTLPTAISYALLNRDAPSAGAACTWLWTAVHPMIGFQAGLLMATYFLMAAIAQPLMFALFFLDLLDVVAC